MDRPPRKRMPWQVIPMGQYEAEIISVAKATSKAGNPMVVMEFAINHGGKIWKVKEYFVEKCPWKVENLAKALGREEDHARKEFRLGALVGTFVRVGVSCEDEPGHGWTNKIVDYIGQADFTPPVTYGDPATQEPPVEESNLPF